MKASGGCQATASVNIAGPSGAPRLELRYARNTPLGNHAEENILLESNEPMMHIIGALINIAPCYNHRYGKGHNCFKFFTATGRILKAVTRRFIPHTNHYTPIFFIDHQTLPG